MSFVQVSGSEGPLVGYAIGRRVGSAVVRNRLRRRIRAAVGEVDGLNEGAYLVAAAPGAVELRSADLRSSLELAARRATEAPHGNSR